MGWQETLTEITRKILGIERRLDRLETIEAPTIGGGGVGAPNDAQYVTLALDAGLTAERVLTEGADVDLVDTGPNGTITVGRGGDTILLFDSGGNSVAEYAATDVGLDAASAAATAGDVVSVPQDANLSSSHTLAASVEYRFLHASVTGQITLGAGTRVIGLEQTRTANSGATLIGVVGPAAGTAFLILCTISAIQSGAGTGIGVQIGNGNVEARQSTIYGGSAGSGYGVQFSGSGTLTDIGCWIYGSTSFSSGGASSTISVTFDAGGDPYSMVYGSVTPGSKRSGVNGAEGVDVMSWRVVDGHMSNVVAVRIPVNAVLAQISYWMEFHGNPDNTNVYREIRLLDSGLAILYEYGETVALTEDAWAQVTQALPAINAAYLELTIANTGDASGLPSPGWYHYVDDIAITTMAAAETSVGTRFDAEPTGVIPAWSAQSAWDIDNYAARHSSDLPSTPRVHVPLGNQVGDTVQWDGAKWEAVPGSVPPDISPPGVELDSYAAPVTSLITADGYAGADTNGIVHRYSAIVSRQISGVLYQVYGFWDDAGPKISQEATSAVAATGGTIELVPASSIDDENAGTSEGSCAWDDAGTLDVAGWRTEVYGDRKKNRLGRYYMWRTGREKKRRSAYGGKFDQLSPERQAQYAQRTGHAPDLPGRA